MGGQADGVHLQHNEPPYMVKVVVLRHTYLKFHHLILNRRLVEWRDLNHAHQLQGNRHEIVDAGLDWQ